MPDSRWVGIREAVRRYLHQPGPTATNDNSINVNIGHAGAEADAVTQQVWDARAAWARPGFRNVPGSATLQRRVGLSYRDGQPCPELYRRARALFRILTNNNEQ